MVEPTAHQPPDSQGHVGYETADASAFYVGLFALGLVLMTAAVMLFLSWMFWRFEASAERDDPAKSPVAGNQTPPSPRLQTQPGAELARLRHAEDETLDSYKWIDRQQGIVQIPIDRAIELLAQRGLPEPKTGEANVKGQERAP